jgi:acetyl-CoA acetyltransferase
MKKVIILGVGSTTFGRWPELSFARLGAVAVQRALKDANVLWKDIQSVYCANTANGSCVGELVEAEIGHTGVPVINVNNACAGGQTAFFLGQQMVALGAYDLVLVLGTERMPRGPIVKLPTIETFMGIVSMVGKHAMKMQRAISEKRYTIDQMAKISVKNHNNGVKNPYAQHKLSLTIADVHNSRMIADPLTLYHCCPTSDGASAAVLCSEAFARQKTTPPFIEAAGGALRTQTYVRGDPNDTRVISVNTAKDAYKAAGIGPEDLDIVELHDNFTISELEHYEDLGLCADGEAGKLIDEGTTTLTGRLPVNTGGGLLSRGHPTAATGVAQICELVWQMRGEAKERQVSNPKVGLSHCCGGDFGMACGVNIVKK